MTDETYQQLISKAISGLPSESLSEILDFVCFLRKRTFAPSLFADEIRQSLMDAELGGLSKAERDHLDEEFANYEQLYPKA